MRAGAAAALNAVPDKGAHAVMAEENEVQKPPMTTAEALGSYHKELLDQGLPTDLVANLVRSAADQLHLEGICVRDRTGASA